jgi:hypothetical protein
VAAIRHYDTPTASVLAVAMAAGVVHGADLRARVEAWAVRLPPSLGCITSMEVCPGSTSIVVGTDRGVIALWDTRFSLLLTAWRHSARAPINALYPYVTVGLRPGSKLQRANKYGLLPSSLLDGFDAPDSVPALALARQLACGVATGEGDVSFWNLESGACLRLLRSLPDEVHPADAHRLPFLAKIRVVGGRVNLADEAMLNAAAAAAASVGGHGLAMSKLRHKHNQKRPPVPSVASLRWRHPLLAAASEARYPPGHGAALGPEVRTLICPLPTSVSSSSASAIQGLPLGLTQADGGSDAAPGRSYSDIFGSGGALSFGGGGGNRKSTVAGVGRGSAGIIGGDGLPLTAGGGGGASGVGFVLGGMRGAGAAVGVDGEPAPNASLLLAYQYGGSSLEGLPVWMLTAGSDRLIRCWDLERPRASHTVAGLAPGQVRDGYEGAWMYPDAPRPWRPDEPTDDLDAQAEAEAEAQLADADEEATAGGEYDNKPLGPPPVALQLRQPRHFLTQHEADGVGWHLPLRARRSRGTKTRIDVLPPRAAALARYPYAHQRSQPVRTIFSQPLADPSREADVMGVGGVSAPPAAHLKGPIPAPTAHEGAITAMAWLDLPTRLLLTGASDGMVKIWR